MRFIINNNTITSIFKKYIFNVAVFYLSYISSDMMYEYKSNFKTFKFYHNCRRCI